VADGWQLPLPSLPARGTTPSGARYVVRVKRPASTEGSGASWCISIVISGEGSNAGEHEGCGASPRTQADARFALDCESGDLFLFGVTRSRATQIGLVPKKPGQRIATYQPPPQLHLAGLFFLATLPASHARGSLIAKTPGGRERHDLDGLSHACRSGRDTASVVFGAL
jgi:hypothetical protein